MECPNIQDVTFSQTSILAIEDIRRIQAQSNNLIKVVGIGHLMNIFWGNAALKSSYALYSTDFKAMSDAMAGVPDIVKRRMGDIAKLTSLAVSDSKERLFWIAISNGCSIQ